jgi:ABC-2 type transport system permease protein
MVNEQGWRRGFANMLRKENREWWRTRRWWINILIWLAIINGIAYLMLWTPEGEGATAVQLPPEVAVTTALVNLMVMAGLFTPIGAVVAVQGSIIDEKKSGTAAWIASKPVSRTAFIVSKLIANSVALIVVTTVIQWAVLYVLFAIRGSTPQIGPFAFGVALLSLHLLFYLTLTLMLGTLFNDRGPVIGIPIGVLFGAMFLMPYLGDAVLFMPWLIIPSGGHLGLATEMMMGQPLATATPILATIVWIIVFVAVALWRFQREEF